MSLSALQALSALKSERARPVLERIAAEPTTRRRGDDAQHQRDRVRIAQKGLEKLDRIRASAGSS
jgi:hypothetical protein